MKVKCPIFYFLPSWTGLIRIQLFSVYHDYIVITVAVRCMSSLILTNESTIRQQWLTPGGTQCMVFNFKKVDPLLYKEDCSSSPLYIKLPSLFAARLFRTLHNKLHNMKALVILSHHDHHFNHLLVFIEKKEFVLVPVSSSGVFSQEKNSL